MMDWNKQEAIAEYLAQNEHMFGAKERLNWPRVITFKLANLPQNEVLDNEFWMAVNGMTELSIAHQPNGTWDLGL